MRLDGSDTYTGARSDFLRFPFTTELDHLAESIWENKKPFASGEEGLQDHRIVEAIYESAITGKPVKLRAVNKLDAFRGQEPNLS